MNQLWNRIIYRAWSPVYDAFFNKGPFLKARKQLSEEVERYRGKSILYVGVGTGADLEFISVNDYQITAIDFSEAMLQQAQRKFPNTSIQFYPMDAENLAFSDEAFDLVIGSLLLSVVPHPQQALKEMLRVTRTGGEVVLFDKFRPKNGRLSLGKRLLRPFIALLGTDIGISFEELMKELPSSTIVTTDESILFKGMYRKIILKKSRIDRKAIGKP